MDWSHLKKALDCEATKPKVLGAYNTAENVWGDLLNVDPIAGDICVFVMISFAVS